jgi:hypothetical protein
LHGNCPKDRLGNRMGTHDMVTYITNNHVWCAWEEGGFWVTDISDIHHLKAVAWFLPPVRSDSARMTSHADDVFEMPDGLSSEVPRTPRPAAFGRCATRKASTERPNGTRRRLALRSRQFLATMEVQPKALASSRTLVRHYRNARSRSQGRAFQCRGRFQCRAKVTGRTRSRLCGLPASLHPRKNMVTGQEKT